jgi:chromosome segregation ATPase
MSAFEGEALEVLRSIRDEVRSTRTELAERIDQTNLRLEQTRVELSGKLDQTNARLDQTNARLDQTNARLDQAIVNIGGIETAIVELSEQQRFMVRSFDTLTRRDHRLEGEIEALRTRVERVEDTLGLGEPER